MTELPAAVDRSLIRNPAFLSIWAAQILSQVAANATTSALIVLVAELTKSNTSSSFLILLAIVPAVIFGIFAGVIVDRTDRRKVLVVTNALRALAVTPLLLLGESTGTAYAVSFLVAAITVFFVPAEAALLPSIVRRRDLLAANSLFTFTFNGAFLVGFIVLAPLMIAFAGFETLFILIGAMFAGSALLCLMLPSVPRARDAEPIDIGAATHALAETTESVRAVMRYLRTAPIVTWGLVYIALMYTLVAMAGALAPGFVREVLGVGERNTAIIIAPAGIGVIAGVGALNLLGGRLGKPRAIGLGLIVTALALCVLAAARPLAGLFRVPASSQLGEALPMFAVVVGVTAFVFGIAYAFITVTAMTTLHEELHDEIRGRVFGVLNMLISVFSLLPLLLVGPIADLWGIAPVFLGASSTVLLVYLRSRSVRAWHAGGRL